MTVDSTWTTVSTHQTSTGRIAYQQDSEGRYRVVERRYADLADDAH